MSGLTSLTQYNAFFTQANLRDPQRFEAATLLEIAEVGRQQQITNSLLRVNVAIAHEQSELMKEILGTVSQMHDAATRERLLKELLYQMSKLLKADEQGKADPVELAFRARLFLDTINQNSLTTADLLNLDEKALFDRLKERADAGLKSPARKELEDFEAVYATYLSQRDVDPAKSVKMPVKPVGPVLSLPEKPTLKEPDEKVAESVEAEINHSRLVAKCVGGFFLVVGVCNAFPNIGPSGNIGGFRGGLTIATLSVVGTALYLRRLRNLLADSAWYETAKSNLEARRVANAPKVRAVEEANQRMLERHASSVGQAKANYAQEEAVFRESMRKHENEISQLKELKREMRVRHQALLNHLASLVNAFLNDHPGLTEFLPKVRSGVVKPA